MTAKTTDLAAELAELKRVLLYATAAQHGVDGIAPAAARRWLRQWAAREQAKQAEPPIEYRGRAAA
jgi:hypothetical protein